MNALDAEVLLGTVYGTILLASAYGLDMLARHSHARADRYRTGGFRFHPHVDAWECPQGEYLHLVSSDPERRLRRYRARPLVCNSCPAKGDCTDSDDGRELVRSLDDWPRSEAGRFHRGISLALVGLASLIAVIVLVRHHDWAEVVLLSAVIAGCGYVGRRLAGELRAEPSDPRALA